MIVSDAARGPETSPATKLRADVIRRDRMRGDQFVHVAREIAADNSLTFAARGLYVYLLSQLQVSASCEIAVAEERGGSTAEIDAAFHELQERGFLTWEDGSLILTDNLPSDPGEQTVTSASHHQKRRSGFVYFVEREGLVKIGFTKNLDQRLKKLNSGGSMPAGMTVGPVTVLAIEHGTLARERELHERFAPWRLPGTEWFKSTPELREYIQDLRAGDSAVVAAKAARGVDA